MKSLDELVNQINFSTILTTGRTGSDYLQGCLDNVPGVLTFSGAIFYYSFCDHFKLNNYEKTEPVKILELFIEKNIHLFTHYSEDNKSVDLNITKFKENFNITNTTNYNANVKINNTEYQKNFLYLYLKQQLAIYFLYIM